MPSRPTAWGDTLMSVLIPSAAQMSPLNLLSALTPSDTITVARLIIHLTVVPANLATAGQATQLVDIGIGVAAAEAFNAGVLPDPNVAGDVPARGWLYADRLVCAHESPSGTLEWGHYSEVRLDLRASRKVDRGILYIVANNSFLEGGASFSVRLIGRVRALCLT